MKTIGLIGGMSWESSAEYYRIINEEVKNRLGGVHSAQTLMYSVDFGEIEILQHQGRWKELEQMMIDAAQRLEKGGADFILICTNTMHKMAEVIEASVNVPLLHIADAAAGKIKKMGLRKVGLLGTKFTMEEGFYKDRLREKHGISVIIPSERERQIVHDIIYGELVVGDIKDSSREEYKEIIRNLAEAGAEGVILGCTEIPLLIKQEDSSIPIFDTTALHSLAAVEFCLK